MKKNKLFGIIFAVICLFGLTSCSTNFCSDEDVNAIKLGIQENIENNTGTGNFAKPTSEVLEAAKVSDVTYYINGEVTYKWEDLSDLGKTFYVNYVYNTYHPKACLVTEDHVDQYSGATISKKTFGFAFKQGLLEIIAYPFSFLIVNTAKILGGGQISGVAVMFAIIIVTFLVRALITLATWKSTKQQQVMQKLQPEMDAINEKYANRVDEQSKNLKAQEMMKLYKKYDVNPTASLVTPFVTLPIFIAFYSAIKDSTLIFEGTLGGLELGAKLGQNITKGNVFAIVLFVVMGGLQFVTMRLNAWLNKKNQKFYEQQIKKKGPSQTDIMSYMFTGMILFIGWVLPVAMSIYWMASSVFTIGQTLLLYKLQEKEKR